MSVTCLNQTRVLKKKLLEMFNYSRYHLGSLFYKLRLLVVSPCVAMVTSFPYRRRNMVRLRFIKLIFIKYIIAFRRSRHYITPLINSVYVFTTKACREIQPQHPNTKNKKTKDNPFAMKFKVP